MTNEQIEQAAIDWRGCSESAYTTDAFKAGALWMQERIISKATEWLEKNRIERTTPIGEISLYPKCFVDSFRRYMTNNEDKVQG